MEINQRADEVLRTNAKENMRVVGHEVAKEHPPNPDDKRILKPASEAGARNKNEVRDVVDLSTNKQTPVEKRDSDFEQSNVRSKKDRVIDQDRQKSQELKQGRVQKEQSVEIREEKIERVQEGREEFRKEEEMKIQQEKQDNGRKNLDLFA